MTDHSFEIDPIGVVRTPFERPADTPKQGVNEATEGEVVLSREYEPGLEGLTSGDSIDVLWLADDADRSTLRVRDGERGVFSTRSPHRPNPICRTTCRVRAVDGTRLAVTGVDMLDESPVVDLKAPMR
ncbi:tRNA (N6-threonylcarbamoyladenosine(37)-N6)-methyltransferase TrmO [Halobiforma nitratireducens]|uniref:TsaA-like domain-containing protein n=1 Tax=Halobiforma nitratireducens JCM 10879 TaxID=1227454 RepID=M0LWR2_9EURY|nr:tRNA (N6-threonylcarbamoyladenosine(37)-N6)-methyltransferase TrmO [Halobiforma nitratireducens]EMA36814.1 hypothetical protein C446_11417 [Halobiforma nitratireducens JCM 10879]